MTADENSLPRLRWRCRRGMRELDQVLERYLDHAWGDADSAERATFLRLLDCEDPVLWPWFVGRERPEDPAMDALVQKIRNAGPRG
ncbi:succinate dehydrogenase assembly factor 2 [Xanthomonadaceae bacterium JHOS43]|nr:succinate dehydrogenase assembly factor 2 [Xanthomonadaceae bacterium JHOS43]MCX7563386.1 succinate dehydrogenase assembly factor 2 [Xanthomonadaceae bacterium XH05]